MTNPTPLIALTGNPNTGKTTLFNVLTGLRARVGNYPGITVDRRVGQLELGETTVDLLDLPGCYSLSSRSREEQIAIEAVLGMQDQQKPDLTLVVVDAGQLLRNLYLVLQLIELQVPLMVVINMLDEVNEPPDLQALSAAFGVPFVGTTARSGVGLDNLRKTLEKALAESPRGNVQVNYSEDLLQRTAVVAKALPAAWRHGAAQDTALAMWALASIDEADELGGIPAELRAAVLEQQKLEGDLDADMITARYRCLEKLTKPPPADEEVKPSKSQRLTDRIDAVALHPVFGFALFVGVMLVVFQALFSWSDPAIGVVEGVFGWLAGLAKNNLPAGFIADLVSEGIIGGVGNVVVFLPQILLLFLLLGFLEDSGYMARAAYLMDRIMKALGLHGRAFVPMLSGCACAIPAIMATRTMERQRDRLLTMLVIPLMTCSARLPIYTLIIGALFPDVTIWGFLPVQGLLMVFMYCFATAVTLIAAAVLGRTVVRGRRMPLLLELPPYRMPTWRSVVRQTFERAGVFLKEAGTVIMAFTIILWGLLSYPAPQEPQPLAQKAIAGFSVALAGKSIDVASEADNTDASSRWKAERLAGSYGGALGKAIEPVIEPLGFDWKLGVGIMGAFAAREVFISTMGLVYGIGGDVDEASTPLREKIASARGPDGRPIYTPLMGMSLMLFFALACQCMSTLAVVKRETRGYKWPAFLFAYMTTLAWFVSFVTYQGGKLLGFS